MDLLRTALIGALLVGSCDGDPCSDHFPVYAEIRMPGL